MVKESKPGLKSMIWNRMKKQTFDQNKMNTQEFKKKMRRGLLGTSGTTLNIPTSKSEGEEEEQEIESLFEKIV